MASVAAQSGASTRLVCSSLAASSVRPLSARRPAGARTYDSSITSRGCSGTCQPPPTSPTTAREHARRAGPGGVPQRAAGADHHRHLAKITTAAADLDTVRPGHYLRAGVPPHGDRGGETGERDVDGGVVSAGQVRRVGGPPLGGRPQRCHVVQLEQPFGDGGIDHADGVPPDPEVALDGSAAPGHLDHLTAKGRLLGIGSHHRVDVGGGPTDVDDEDVPGPGHVARTIGEQLHTAQHGVRRRGLDERGELLTAARQVLAADDVADEDLADRRPGRLWIKNPDAWQHVGGRDHLLAARHERHDDLIADVDVAGDHERAAQA